MESRFRTALAALERATVPLLALSLALAAYLVIAGWWQQGASFESPSKPCTVAQDVEARLCSELEALPRPPLPLREQTTQESYLRIEHLDFLLKGKQEWRALPRGLGNPPTRTTESEAWYRIPLPRGNWRDPILFSYAVDTEYAVFFEKRLLTRYGPFEGPSHFSTGWWRLSVALPLEALGGEVYVRVRSSGANLGLTHPLFVGERSAINDSFVLIDFSDAAIGLCLMTLGCLLGITWLSLWHHRSKDVFLGEKGPRLREEMAYLSLFALTSGLFWVSTAHILRVRTGSGIALISLEIALLALMHIAFLRYLRAVSQDLSLLIVPEFLFAFFLLLAFLRQLPSSESIVLYQGVPPLQFLSLGGILLLLAKFLWSPPRLGNSVAQREVRILLGGIVLFISTCLFDLARSMQSLLSTNHEVFTNIAPLGALAFVGTLTLVSGGRVAHRILESYEKEKALHESEASLREKERQENEAQLQKVGEVAIIVADRLNTPLQIIELSLEEMTDVLAEWALDNQAGEEYTMTKDLYLCREKMESSISQIRERLKPLDNLKRYADVNVVRKNLDDVLPRG